MTTVDAGDMHAELQANGEELLCTIQAPTTGWLLIGFNSPGKGLSGARLIMMALDAGQVRAEVHRASPPNHGRRAHPPELDRVRVLAATAVNGVTTFRVAIPFAPEAVDDVTLRPGEEAEVILAWAAAADFQHHSTKREHRVVRLPR